MNEHDAQPPHDQGPCDDYDQAPRKATGAVLLLAWIAIIFGAVAIFQAGTSIAWPVILEMLKKRAPAAFGSQPGIPLARILMNVVHGGLGIVGIFVGIKLLALDPFGRRMAIALGWTKIGAAAIDLLCQLIIDIPHAMDAVASGATAGGGGGAPPAQVLAIARAAASVGAFIGFAVNMVFPGLMIYFLTRPDAKLQFGEDPGEQGFAEQPHPSDQRPHA